jgi:peptide deformylase
MNALNMGTKRGVVKDIIHLGHPTLRQKADRVTEIQSPEIQALIDRLFDIVKSANGVGIAAPQVDVSLQIMVIASRPNPRYPDAPTMEPIALINPKILSYSPELEKGWEGCLSVPDWRGKVPRHPSITVEYTDRTGHLIRSTFTGFVARIFQHEYDHLQGVVFLDRLGEDEGDRMTETEFQQLFPNNLPRIHNGNDPSNRIER